MMTMDKSLSSSRSQERDYNRIFHASHFPEVDNEPGTPCSWARNESYQEVHKFRQDQCSGFRFRKLELIRSWQICLNAKINPENDRTRTDDGTMKNDRMEQWKMKEQWQNNNRTVCILLKACISTIRWSSVSFLFQQNQPLPIQWDTVAFFCPSV